MKAYLRRGARLWMGARALLSAVLLLARINPLAPSAMTSVVMVGITGCLGWVEVQRRHERALLGNMGVAMPLTWATVALPAVLGEVLLRLTGYVVR